MKVYVYNKKDKHKRLETITNVKGINETERTFILITSERDFIYAKKDFMFSVYGY